MVLWCLAACLLTGVHAAWATRLPEPDDASELGKLPYRKLAAPTRLAGLVLTAGAALVATLVVPAPARAPWLVFGSALAVLVWVDACTTWLPTRLSWPVSIELLAAVGVSLLWAPHPGALAVRIVAGAAAAGVLFYLFWLRGGIGFGDVRLAPLIGGLAATMGLTGWFAALLSGTAVGAVWGLIVARRHPAPGTVRGFAYGPALWVGPYIALVWTAFTSSWTTFA